MKLILKKGLTSQRIAVFIQNSASTVGAGLTGLVFNSAGLAWYYWREDEGNVAATAVTLATATRGTFASGGFVEKDATNLPGWYEIGIPDAALAAGADWVGVMLKGATNMAPLPLEIELVDVDLADTVRMGLTALPNAVAQGVGGLYTRGSGAGQINQNSNGQVDTRTVTMDANVVTDAAVAADVTIASVTGAVGSVTAGVTLAASAVQAIWDAATSALTIVGSIGKKLADWAVGTITTYTGNTPQTGDAFARIGAAGAGLTSLGDTRIANLDAAVSSRMATFTLPTNFSALSITAAGLVAVTSNVKKNQALAAFEFLMVLASDHITPATALTVTATRSIDGGAFAACTNAVTEVASGVYAINLAAADLNGNVVTLKFAAATADTSYVTITTQP